MALVKLIFFACVFSTAVIFLEASDSNDGTPRIKGEKIEIFKAFEDPVVEEVEVDKVIEEVEVDEVVDGEVKVVDEVHVDEEIEITEIEDENAEKDISDGNLSGGLLDTPSDEERRDELVDNIRMVDDLEEKLHDNFEGEREMEN